MDFSSGYIAVPKKVSDSLVQTDEKVALLGKVDLKDFETEFRDKISEGVFNTEKAVQLGLLNPSPSLSSVGNILAAKLPKLY